MGALGRGDVTLYPDRLLAAVSGLAVRHTRVHDTVFEESVGLMDTLLIKT